MDSLSLLTRVLVNVNSERPNTEPVPLVPRPLDAVAPAPQTISLNDFTALLKEDP